MRNPRPTLWPARWASACIVTAIVGMVIILAFPPSPVWAVLVVELVSAAGVLLTPLMLDAARQRGDRHIHGPSSGYQPDIEPDAGE